MVSGIGSELPVRDLVAVASSVQPVDWLAIGPPLAVAVTALVVLVVDAFLPVRRRGLAPWLSLLGLLVALGLLVPLAAESGPRGVFCAGGALEPPAACSYVVDPLTLVFQLIAAGGAALVVLLSAGRAGARADRAATGTLGAGVPPGEYHFLLLASVTGAMTLAGARDLITLVVALEVVSLPAFALVGLRRGDGRGAEAALKFFLVSVVSVAVMLFGVSFVYGATGTVYLDRIAAVLRSGGLATLTGDGMAAVAGVGVVLTLVGLAFKVAAVPFHFWVPDTYVGAPIPVAAYLSVVSKAAGFVGLLLVVSIAFPSYADVWGPALGVLAALTMTLGNLVALRQRNAVRLLAWSSVAQAGYLLVPLGTGGGNGVLAATVAYLLIYAVINLGAFAVVALCVAAPGRGRFLDDYRGLFWRRPLRALALGFFLLALAGLPPGVLGLFGKVVLFRAAIDGGAGWLAVVMAVNVVIALAYYLYWTALLFLPARSEEDAAAVADDGTGAGTATEVGTGAVAGAVASSGNGGTPAGASGVTLDPWPARLAVVVLAVLAVVLSVAPNLAIDVLRHLPTSL